VYKKYDEINRQILYMMEQTLQELGLSQKEVQVYLALLAERQAVSTVELAQKADLARTTVYDIVTTLMEKGLVSERKRGSTKVFEVDTPHHLFAYVHHKETQLETGKSQLKLVMSELERLKNPLLPAPSMSLYVGQEGLLRMWEMHVSEAMLTERSVRFLCNAQFFAQMNGELKSLGKRFADQGCIVKVLVYSPDEDPVFLKSRNFEVKTLKQELTFTSGMDIMGSYVGYWTQEGSEYHASSMENASISHMHQALFESLWAMEY